METVSRSALTGAAVRTVRAMERQSETSDSVLGVTWFSPLYWGLTGSR